MKVLVTGHKGMVGTAVLRYCRQKKIECKVFDNTIDLRDPIQVEYAFERSTDCTHLLHLAARVGGVKANMKNQHKFFSDNIIMNMNVLENAAQFGNFKKVISMMSTCVYPALTSYPLHEYQLHLGSPHETNFGYAYAKRMLDVQSKALNQRQSTTLFQTVIPNNIYGENDNYHLENSHVIPAITRKMWETKLRKADTVELWGDGTPEREFTYSRDIAAILFWLLENYEDTEPLNIGTTESKTIAEVADIIKAALAWDEGKIKWNTDQPKGQKKKPTSNYNFQSIYKKIEGKEYEYRDIEDGLIRTTQQFIMDYPNLRGCYEYEGK